ncbi:MAG: HEPN domain-containing protein [Myxococcota bacterium]
MTQTNRHAHAGAELRRAREALREAEALQTLGLHNGAASRAYYGAFHAACALLAAEDLRARSHDGVQALLHERWFGSGRLAPEHETAFGRLRNRRGVADYQAVETITPEEAASLVAAARAFVETASALLADAAAKNPRDP